MERVIRTASLTVFSVLVAGAWLLMPAYTTQAKNAAPTYDAKCAMCHGKDGSGNTPMGKNMKVPDLTSKAVQSKSNAVLYNVIDKGKGVMPAYGSQMSKTEINQMVMYVRHLSKKK